MFDKFPIDYYYCPELNHYIAFNIHYICNSCIIFLLSPSYPVHYYYNPLPILSLHILIIYNIIIVIYNIVNSSLYTHYDILYYDPSIYYKPLLDTIKCQ